jgi:hypothetical protein
LPPSSSPLGSLPDEDLIETEIPELDLEEEDGEDLFGDNMEK